MLGRQVALYLDSSDAESYLAAVEELGVVLIDSKSPGMALWPRRTPSYPPRDIAGA